MRPGLKIGDVAELTRHVDAPSTIALGGRLPVFSTPAMIDLMEHAARQALAPWLEANEESVGVDVQVTHLAATPPGQAVRGVARVASIDGRQIGFEVAAYDAREPIGRGTHRRAVVAVDRFAQRLAEKGAPMPESTLVAPPTLVPDRGALPAFDTLDVRVEGGVARARLNRPAAYNAVTPEMSDELLRLIQWLMGHEQEVRAVVLTGAGKAFCGGDDLKRMARHTIEESERWNVSEARLFMAFEQVGQPLVAQINGPCFGAGVVLALACDIRVASRTATFGMPEVRLGWPPAFALPQLAAAIGKANTMHWVLRGHTIGAEQALAMGLVHETATPTVLERHVARLAEELAALPPVAARETRRLLHRILPDATGFTETQTNAAYLRCLATEDAKEGLAAFREKRPPTFRGR